MALKTGITVIWSDGWRAARKAIGKRILHQLSTKVLSEDVAMPPEV
jgi:hypothetical protein